MILTAAEAIARNAFMSRHEIREAMSGNLCRCTGYEAIVDAVEACVKGDRLVIPNRAIGSSRPRTDAKVLVEGRGCYLDDVPVSSPLHISLPAVACLMTSAGILSVDAKAAQGAAEAIGVFKRKRPRFGESLPRMGNLSNLSGAADAHADRAGADTEALYVGQPVVAVVAGEPRVG